MLPILPKLLAAAIGLLTITLALGCTRARPPADAALARATLHSALESWKQGTPPDELQDREPPVHVADHEWAGGAKLLAFEVDRRDQHFGADLRCSVRLTLEGNHGKPRNKKATYSVGTGPALTVVREDDD